MLPRNFPLMITPTAIVRTKQYYFNKFVLFFSCRGIELILCLSIKLQSTSPWLCTWSYTTKPKVTSFTSTTSTKRPRLTTTSKGTPLKCQSSSNTRRRTNLLWMRFWRRNSCKSSDKCREMITSTSANKIRNSWSGHRSNTTNKYFVPTWAKLFSSSSNRWPLIKSFQPLWSGSSKKMATWSWIMSTILK